MSVALSKIRKGDKVHVEMFVHDTFTGGIISGGATIPTDMLVKHIPAPRPIEVGCTVSPIKGDNNRPKYIVLGVHENEVWLKNTNTTFTDYMSMYFRVD